MAGKQAKILNDDHVQDLLVYAAHSRYPLRNSLIVLLSAKAGLRAGEIAALTWDMILGADGLVSSTIELHDKASKKAERAAHTHSCRSESATRRMASSV